MLSMVSFSIVNHIFFELPIYLKNICSHAPIGHKHISTGRRMSKPSFYFVPHFAA